MRRPHAGTIPSPCPPGWACAGRTRMDTLRPHSFPLAYRRDRHEPDTWVAAFVPTVYAQALAEVVVAVARFAAPQDLLASALTHFGTLVRVYGEDGARYLCASLHPEALWRTVTAAGNPDP